MPVYGDDAGINGVSLRLVLAGHVLGSAQAVVEHGGTRIVVSGDYNRRPHRPVRLSNRCPATSCVTEATSALPVFRHSDEGAIAGLPHSVATFPERAHLVGTYALEGAAGDPPVGRRLGPPIYIHGALETRCALHEELACRQASCAAQRAQIRRSRGVVFCRPGQLTE